MEAMFRVEPDALLSESGRLPDVAAELDVAAGRVETAARAAAAAAGAGPLAGALAAFAAGVRDGVGEDAADVRGIAETLATTADNYAYTDEHALRLA